MDNYTEINETCTNRVDDRLHKTGIVLRRVYLTIFAVWT